VKATAFRRSFAFLFDILIVMFLLSLVFRLAGDRVIKGQIDNFQEIYDQYQSDLSDYYDSRDSIIDDYTNEIITIEARDTQLETLSDEFNTLHEGDISTIFKYYYSVTLFFIFGFGVINYGYNLLLHGQTFGRKFMKVELTGNINWWSLLLREFFWKSIFWGITLGLGIIVDLLLISLTKNKKTIRDRITNTYVIYSGTVYPF
jgi:predicted PurR-regulated permease PerM